MNACNVRTRKNCNMLFVECLNVLLTTTRLNIYTIPNAYNGGIH